MTGRPHRAILQSSLRPIDHFILHGLYRSVLGQRDPEDLGQQRQYQYNRLSNSSRPKQLRNSIHKIISLRLQGSLSLAYLRTPLHERAVSSVGLEHLVYTEGVGGSSPSLPTHISPNSIFELGLFRVRLLNSAYVPRLSPVSLVPTVQCDYCSFSLSTAPAATPYCLTACVHLAHHSTSFSRSFPFTILALWLVAMARRRANTSGWLSTRSCRSEGSTLRLYSSGGS